MTPKQQQLIELLGPSVTALDLELWAIEIIGRANRSTLRLVIDHPDRLVTVDDCEAVSRQVSRILDVEDPLPERYTLEVSSPGVDRLLFHPDHYQPYVGEMVDIRLRLPVEGRRRFKGVLSSADAEMVVVTFDDLEFNLPFRSIDRARAYPRLDIGSGKS